MLPRRAAARGGRAALLLLVHARSRSSGLSHSSPVSSSLSSTHHCSPSCPHTQPLLSIATFSTSTPLRSSPLSSSTTSSASSTSSNPSTSSYIPTLTSVSLALLAAGAVTLGLSSTASSEPASTELPPISPSPPLLPLPRISPTPIISPSRSFSSLSTPPRPSLPNPGKFDHSHRESSLLTNSNSFSGGRLQKGIAPLPEPEDGRVDKVFQIIPILSAGPDGGHGMVQIRTDLGHRHRLEAMLDTQLNVTGRYKLIHAPWIFKPSFMVAPQQPPTTTLTIHHPHHPHPCELCSQHSPLV